MAKGVFLYFTASLRPATVSAPGYLFSRTQETNRQRIGMLTQDSSTGETHPAAPAACSPSYDGTLISYPISTSVEVPSQPRVPAAESM